MDPQRSTGARISQQFYGHHKKFSYVANGVYEQTGVFHNADGDMISPRYGLVFNAGLRYIRLKAFKPFFSYSQGFSVTDLGRLLHPATENTVSQINSEAVIVNNEAYRDEEDVYLSKTTFYVRYHLTPDWMFKLRYRLPVAETMEAVEGKYSYDKGPIEGFTLLNLFSSYTFNDNIDFRFGTENLLNKDYYIIVAWWYALDDSYVKGNGIRFNLGIQVNFKEKVKPCHSLIYSCSQGYSVVSPGIEPGSWVPETHVVSILLRDQNWGKDKIFSL